MCIISGTKGKEVWTCDTVRDKFYGLVEMSGGNRRRINGVGRTGEEGRMGHDNQWSKQIDLLPYLSCYVPVKNEFVTTISPAVHLK